MSNIVAVIIISIIEGLTEFLPVSSTGHMILAEKFLTKHTINQQFLNSFYMIIQFGAIIAVVIYFWKDLTPFLKNKDEFRERMVLWSKIIIGVLPAAVFGILLDEKMESLMSGITVVAVALIFYGVIFLFIEDKLKGRAHIHTLKDISYKIAFYIGFFQCLAMVPGTSRSGATIIGALILGVSRGAAAEFSFFLAIPTMAGATLLKLLKNGMNFTGEEWFLLALGSLISFIVAYFVIKWFMSYIKTKNFKIFGVYRIILGIIILLTLI